MSDPIPTGRDTVAAADTASAALASMTGFARCDGMHDGTGWLLEARSVNARGFDLRCRFPAGFDAVDAVARSEAALRFRRGTVSVNLTILRGERSGTVRINHALLDRYVALAREIRGDGGAVNVEALLGLRGVVEADDGQDGIDTGLADAVAAALPGLLDDLAAARREEGARLAALLHGHVDRIEALAAEARASAGAQPAAIRDRLARQIEELLPGGILPDDRMAQEVALMAARADVREELDRLDAHVAQARALLNQGGAVGRRLDFLSQEFNREANTLCSKSADITLTRLGLDLKAAIEQFREQVQNVE